MTQPLRLLLLLLSLATISVAQTTPPQLLKSSDLQSDAAILRSAYEQLHPGLYRYNSKSQMDANFAALNHQLAHDQSLQDAFLAFSQFAAKVRCGHTQANPFNQPKPIVEALFKNSPRVPFYFVWLNRRMIVTHDFTSNNSLPRGTEILAINGITVAKILAKLLTITRADGSNDAKRIAQLAVTGDSQYETFDLYYPMFFPPKNTNFALTVRKPSTKSPQKISVPASNFAERAAALISETNDDNNVESAPRFTYEYLDDNSAYLRMPTWALYNSKWDWKTWLNHYLNEAVDRHPPALIIDLRGNEGGNDVGNEIIPYLIDVPLHLSSMRRFVRYREVPDNLIPYLDTWDKSFRDWGPAAVDLATPWPTAPLNVTYLKLTRYDDEDSGDPIKPAAKRFTGKVIVLIDATNSSATFQFAQAIQSNHLGTLIGQPTGGSQRGINGGAFFFLRLPHSQIELDLPLIATFPPTPQPDAGITPDIQITPTIQDITTNHDPALAAAQHVARH